jgi:hypothetical protein
VNKTLFTSQSFAGEIAELIREIATEEKKKSDVYAESEEIDTVDKARWGNEVLKSVRNFLPSQFMPGFCILKTI